MSKKIDRKMKAAGQAQRDTEKNVEDKFAQTQNLAHPQTVIRADSTTGRISPQLSCTIAPEDKKKLNELTLFLSNKKGRVLNTSAIIRSLIRLGERYKEELDA